MRACFFYGAGPDYGTEATGPAAPGFGAADSGMGPASAGEGGAFGRFRLLANVGRLGAPFSEGLLPGGSIRLP